jgi:Tfp pilus assembly protein PilN
MKTAPLQLDFIRPPRRPLWLGLLLLAVALGFAAELALRWQTARSELSRVQAANNLINGDRPRAKPVPVERLDEHVKAAEAVVRNLTLPWASLIETLEGTSNPDVAVLQIQPDAQQGLLRISGEARNQSAMWLYVRNLSAARSLDEVHLLNHQVQQEDPQKPLQFSVQAKIKAAI